MRGFVKEPPSVELVLGGEGFGEFALGKVAPHEKGVNASQTATDERVTPPSQHNFQGFQ